MKDHMGSMPTWKFRQERAYAGALMVHDLGWLNRENYAAALGGTWREWTRPNMLMRPENVFVPYWAPEPVAPNAPSDLYVSAWKRDGWCSVTLVNWSTNRVEAELQLDLQAMGFGRAAPDEVSARDVDSRLLTYFDDDVTLIEKPETVQVDMMGEAGDDPLEDLTLEEPPTLEERRTADPDGEFEWKDGILRCPVRRHDFRLFEFEGR
jgi:hypothetical protein